MTIFKPTVGVRRRCPKLLFSYYWLLWFFVSSSFISGSISFTSSAISEVFSWTTVLTSLLCSLITSATAAAVCTVAAMADAISSFWVSSDPGTLGSSLFSSFSTDCSFALSLSVSSSGSAYIQ